MEKKGRKVLVVLFGVTKTRTLDKNRIVIDNREWWHYKVHNGGKEGRVTDGMDGMVVCAAGSRTPGHVSWSGVKTVPADTALIARVGPRGVKFLQNLMKKKGFSAIEELHIVSAWQFKILVAVRGWSDPDKLVLPVLKKVLGRRIIVEKWDLPDTDVM